MEIDNKIYDKISDLLHKKTCEYLGFDLPLNKICTISIIGVENEQKFNADVIKLKGRVCINNLLLELRFPYEMCGDHTIYNVINYKLSIFTGIILADFVDKIDIKGIIYNGLFDDLDWEIRNLELMSTINKPTNQSVSFSHFKIYNKPPFTIGLFCTEFKIEDKENQGKYGCEYWVEKIGSDRNNMSLYCVYNEVVDESLLFNDLEDLILRYEELKKKYAGLTNEEVNLLRIDVGAGIPSLINIKQKYVSKDLAIFEFIFPPNENYYNSFIQRFYVQYVAEKVRLKRVAIVSSNIVLTHEEIRSGI